MDAQGKIRVYLCHDHFQRLCRGEVCDQCPSKLEHEGTVRMLAELSDTEEARINEALLNEAKSVRRAQQAMQRDLRSLAEDVSALRVSVNGDGNGDKGLKTRVTLIEHDLMKGESRIGHWIAGAAIVISIITWAMNATG